MQARAITPNVLTIAGSDSGGGAGIQADLKTFSACGVYGASVITALTAQNTKGVCAVHDVPTEFVTAQLDAVFSDIKIAAVKIGMVSQPSVIAAITDALDKYRPSHIVVDPVMVATSGDTLLSRDALGALRTELIPRAHIITPNLPEAAALLEESAAKDESDIRDQAQRLLTLGCPAVLIKGGHGGGATSVDYLATGKAIVPLAAPRIATANTHGTGCSLSSAIAAYLARGESLERAVTHAKDYVHGAIAASDQLKVGQGHGPIHHFHQLWRQQ